MTKISKIKVQGVTHEIKDNEAYVKPASGIPASDIASGVIPDVSAFITKSVNDLTNYYTKSQTYTQTEVNNLIGAINQFKYEIAASTSAVTSPQSNVLYLIGPTGSGSDQYEEYVYPNSTTGWVKIGDTSIDLSGYVTTTALNTALANYTLSTDIPFEKGTGTSSAQLKGTGSTASGSGSVAIGTWSAASGTYSHAEGYHAAAPGEYSHAEGERTISSGGVSHTEGYRTTASSYYSHAEGNYTTASGEASHAEGNYTTTSNTYEHAQGMYNVSHTSDSTSLATLHSVGVGTASNARANAFEIMKNGDIYAKGLGGYDGTNPSSANTLQEVISGKQDTISDLGTIRSGAALGASAVQTETDPTVPAWAKASTKPSYNFSEIGGIVADSQLPDTISSDITGTAMGLKTEKLTGQEFVYRACPSTIKAKSLTLDRIYGKTLAWNQMAPTPLSSSNNGITWTAQSDGSLIVNGTSTGTVYSNYISGIYVIGGHKYIYRNSLNSTKYGIFNSGVGVNVRGNTIFTPTVSGNITCQFMVDASGVAFNNEKIFTVVIDLTFMFGAGNEPSTVAEFEALYPGYHSYSAGKLISNDAESIETVGFNLWDEEYTLTGLNDDGTPYTGNVYLTSKNYIPVKPNTAYYFRVGSGYNNLGMKIVQYDANKTKVGTNISKSGAQIPFSFTTDANCYYIKFNFNQYYGTTYNHDICINLSDPAKNGTYEPYRKSTMQLGLNSFKVKSHNIWDEEWESGSYDTITGAPSPSDAWSRSKNAMSVKASTTYYATVYGVSSSNYYYIFFYSADGSFLYFAGSFSASSSFTTPENCAFIRIEYKRTIDTVSSYLVCINVSSSFNGQYEPHGDITITGGLKSAGTVKDEIVGNKYIKRVGSVDLGTLSWTYDSGNSQFYSERLPAYSSGDAWNTNALCAKYRTSVHGSENRLCGLNGTRAYLIDSSYTDAATFKTAMSGVMLYYELATPIEYTLVSPLVPTVAAGTTEARISPNSDGLSAPMVADMTYSVADYIEYVDKAGALVKGASVDLTDIVASGELSGNAFKVLAEHIAKLTSRVETLENGIGTLDTLSSTSVDSANGYYINGDKTVIIGSGAPTEVPAFAGQFYINTSGPALYYAVNNSATTDWKQA